jgi:Tetratricopeptide repeat
MFRQVHSTITFLLAVVMLLSIQASAQRPKPTRTPIPAETINTVKEANELLRLGHQQKAIAIYKMVIDKAPKYTEARYRLGLAHLLAGQYLEGEASLKIVLKQNRKHTLAQNMLKKYQRQIEDAKSAIPTPTPFFPPVAPTVVSATAPTHLQSTSKETIAPSTGISQEFAASIQKYFGGTDSGGISGSEAFEDLDINKPAILLALFLSLCGFSPFKSFVVRVICGIIAMYIPGKEEHGYFAFLYGYFCGCCGFIFVLIPAKISKIIFFILMAVHIIIHIAAFIIVAIFL